MKSWGSLVLSSATTVTEALWLQAHGADAIIAQGLEAGGHRGIFLSDDLSTQMGTMALLPQIVQAVGLIDLYQGANLPAGKKSLAFRVVMQDTERTLTDVEADAARDALVGVWGRRFGAILRA